MRAIQAELSKSFSFDSLWTGSGAADFNTANSSTQKNSATGHGEALGGNSGSEDKMFSTWGGYRGELFESRGASSTKLFVGSVIPATSLILL